MIYAADSTIQPLNGRGLERKKSVHMWREIAWVLRFRVCSFRRIQKRIFNPRFSRFHGKRERTIRGQVCYFGNLARAIEMAVSKHLIPFLSVEQACGKAGWTSIRLLKRWYLWKCSRKTDRMKVITIVEILIVKRTRKAPFISTRSSYNVQPYVAKINQPSRLYKFPHRYKNFKICRYAFAE